MLVTKEFSAEWMRSPLSWSEFQKAYKKAYRKAYMKAYYEKNKLHTPL